MPCARTRRGRVRQIASWLKSTHPCAAPVELRFVRWENVPRSERIFGWAEKVGARSRITIVDARSWGKAVLIETLLHEWAHCLVAMPARWEGRAGLTSQGRARPRDRFPHDGPWALAYGSLVESFWDNDPPGSTESYRFPEVYRP